MNYTNIILTNLDLYKYLNEYTTLIYLDYNNDDYSSLLNKFSIFNNIKRLSIVKHYIYDLIFEFTYKCYYNLNDDSILKFVDFLNILINKHNIQIIEFIICNVNTHIYWTNAIQLIKKYIKCETIFYDNDIKLDNDYIISNYFNRKYKDELSKYKLLDHRNPTHKRRNIFRLPYGDAIPWGKWDQGGNPKNPSTGLSGSSSLNQGLILIGSNPYMSNIICVCGSVGAYGAIDKNGNLYAWGSSSYGGSFGLYDTSTSLFKSYIRPPAGTSGVHYTTSGNDILYSSFTNTYSGYSSNKPFETIQTGNYCSLYSIENGFAALKTDGTVAIWGAYVNASSPEQSNISSIGNLSNIVNIYSNQRAFAAVDKNGAVSCWGQTDAGGSAATLYPNGSSISSNVIDIAGTARAFAALKNDGTVICWGNSSYGGSGTGSAISNVIKISSTAFSFAGKKKDNSVVVWGDSTSGGSMSSIFPSGSSINNNCIDIYSNEYAFAAMLRDSDTNALSIVTWGMSNYGGSISSSINQDIVTVEGSSQGFVAIKKTGSLVKWGTGENSTDYTTSSTSSMRSIFSNTLNFAMIRNSFALAYVEAKMGGTAPNPAVTTDMRIVFSSSSNFAAINGSGRVCVWGDQTAGGINYTTNSVYQYDDTNQIQTDVTSYVTSSSATGSVYVIGAGYTSSSFGSMCVLKPTLTDGQINLSSSSYNYLSNRDKFYIMSTPLLRSYISGNFDISGGMTYSDSSVYTSTTPLKYYDITLFDRNIYEWYKGENVQWMPNQTVRCIKWTEGTDFTSTFSDSTLLYLVGCIDGERFTINSNIYTKYGNRLYKVSGTSTYTEQTSNVNLSSTMSSCKFLLGEYGAIFYDPNYTCFLKGTYILTINGYKKIENIDITDKLIDRNNKIINIKKIHYFVSHTYMPYIIKKDSIDNNIPNEDLYITGFHAVKINNRLYHPCHKKLNIFDLFTEHIGDYYYYNIETDNYFEDTIIANNLEIETLCNNNLKQNVKWNCCSGENDSCILTHI